MNIHDASEWIEYKKLILSAKEVLVNEIMGAVEVN